MSAPWWGREAVVVRQPIAELLAADGTPRLVADVRDAVLEDVRRRTPAFTPEWTNRGADDAGSALVQLFAGQMEMLLSRVNRLPEKALVEYLRMGGIDQGAVTPAVAVLQFSLADSALEPVLVGRGFQVGAPSATGGDMVVFETERDLAVVPATIAELDVVEGRLFVTIDLQAKKPFLPFGKKPIVGRTLLIGLTVASGAALGSSLTVGVTVAAPLGPPAPVDRGGLVPFPAAVPVVLAWEVIDGGQPVAASVVYDDTGGFRHSGTVELRLPPTWRPATITGPAPLCWLQVRIAQGAYDAPPSLAALHVNVVPALAVRTILNEILEPVADGSGRRFRLQAAPVVPESLEIRVDEESSGATDSLPLPGAPPPGTVWRRVDDLSTAGPDDRVYVLDPTTGEVTFGDGVSGAVLPTGVGNVRAARYQSGGGRSGSVAADQIDVLLDSAPFVVAVTNPEPASGGSDVEPQDRTVRRGPAEIRARGRAVTVADYAELALRAPGADVRRAYAVGGLHPTYPGRPIPGVVGVFVVPPLRDAGPPIPGEATLAAVADYLSAFAAPAGVAIVAAAPRYQRVRTVTRVVLDPDAQVNATVRAILTLLDTYLDPLDGGDDGDGWPFGAPVRYARLMRLLLAVPGVAAIPQVTLTLDGCIVAPCADVLLDPYALPWPEGHEVVPVAGTSP